MLKGLVFTGIALVVTLMSTFYPSPAVRAQGDDPNCFKQCGFNSIGWANRDCSAGTSKCNVTRCSVGGSNCGYAPPDNIFWDACDYPIDCN